MILHRFRGQNGIFQLIALLETCSKTRRLHLFNSISADSPACGAIVKTKVLTIDHISSWTSVELRRLSAELNNDLRSRLFSVLAESGHSAKLRELGVPQDSKFKTFPLPEHDELDVLIVLKVRELERIGILELWRFDPTKSMHDPIVKQDQPPDSKAA
ncbi:MAG: hypothetical protein J0L82_14295 [Deltaproteobacteria bacterium]|nr:hypothetical protein [Deltaproteobacteria bacterium]